MWVTHAFRKDGQDIGGTIVPPASKSNHLVGHAIDMNLDTPRNAYQIPLFSAKLFIALGHILGSTAYGGAIDHRKYDID